MGTPQAKVGNQLGNGCKGLTGTVVASGAACQTVCASGYTPSVVTLQNFSGTKWLGGVEMRFVDSNL